jgi:hypothetical protein
VTHRAIKRSGTEIFLEVAVFMTDRRLARKSGFFSVTNSATAN